MITQKQNSTGFTILEVIVALVIVGISMTMFVRLLGNSSMLRGKLNDYDERLDVAIYKTEQMFLGLLESDFTQDADRRVLLGTVKDKEINWRVEDRKDDSFDGQGRDVHIYTVSVDGIDISSTWTK